MNFTATKYIIALLSVANEFASAQKGTNVLEPFTWVDISIDPENTDEVIITVEMVKDNWVGIGFGAGMKAGNDMIMIDGTAQEAYDMFSIGNLAPRED